jgi:hypothetical protein
VRKTLVSIAACCALVSIGGEHAGADPIVGVSAASAEPGQVVLVTSRGWAPGTLVTIELCGERGVGGSSDCAIADQRTATADANGELVEPLNVSIPPSPCPCVVKTSAFGGTSVATVPVVVVGAPYNETPLPEGSVTPALEIVDAHLEGSGPWTALFGSSPERTLVVTLRNPGESQVRGAELYVTVGEGEQPTHVVTTPRLDPLQPGETTVVRVPVSFGALSWGEKTVRAEVVGLADASIASDSASSYPWALITLAVILVQVVLITIRNKYRRRVARREALVDETQDTAPEDLDSEDIAPVGADALATAASAENEDEAPIDLREPKAPIPLGPVREVAPDPELDLPTRAESPVDGPDRAAPTPARAGAEGIEVPAAPLVVEPAQDDIDARGAGAATAASIEDVEAALAALEAAHEAIAQARERLLARAGAASLDQAHAEVDGSAGLSHHASSTGESSVRTRKAGPFQHAMIDEVDASIRQAVERALKS